MISKYIVVLLFSVLFTTVGYKLSLKIDYNDYKDVLSALLNISSIIFAIIGAWIAIIYPKAITKVFGSDINAKERINEAEADTKYLAELVEIALVSALVLMAVLTVQFAYPIIRKMQCFESIVIPCKIAAFMFITFITFLQLYAVSRVILTNYLF